LAFMPQPAHDPSPSSGSGLVWGRIVIQVSPETRHGFKKKKPPQHGGGF
jgi:hypothetical protein